ncbi:hypothetical protein VTJ83DRAFT_7504 [Remersonia thermophila]|uniref:Uncharacterized protein n=1 Tax=Remersonia thermophila TaxID=72144 RepID=A0ABR4D4R7_9PEZI
MMTPKRSLLLLPRAATAATTRCLATSAARPLAMPAGGRGPQQQQQQPSSSASQNPVDDIDLVFDYPTEAQTSHQKMRLAESGLDLHSAMSRGPEGVPGKTAERDMGAADASSMYKYLGVGALGLGGLYMMMRRQSAGPVLTQPNDLAATKPGEGSSMQRVFGRDK